MQKEQWHIDNLDHWSNIKFQIQHILIVQNDHYLVVPFH
jgi:hypothetical protein